MDSEMVKIGDRLSNFINDIGDNIKTDKPFVIARDIVPRHKVEVGYMTIEDAFDKVTLPDGLKNSTNRNSRVWRIRILDDMVASANHVILYNYARIKNISPLYELPDMTILVHENDVYEYLTNMLMAFTATVIQAHHSLYHNKTPYKFNMEVR